jgi:hypothetical protein
MLERLDPLEVLEQVAERPCKLAVNMRVGQVLVIQPEVGSAIHITLKAKHGNGGRLEVLALRSVKILTPDA